MVRRSTCKIILIVLSRIWAVEGEQEGSYGEVVRGSVGKLCFFGWLVDINLV